MRRPVLFRFYSVGSAKPASGYTLVEILVSTALSLILLGAVVRMFGDVGQSITDSRSMLEAADRLRLTAARLQQDLAGVTVPMNQSPPRKPENNEGYFEYIEGPQTSGTNYAVNTDNGGVVDSTVGDVDDILMFTTRSTGQPFVGRYNGGTVQSDAAEVSWFVRGRTLYRRVLLVAPALSLAGLPQAGFYASNDISVSVQNGQFVANTLGDLTKRENRYAHQTGVFPYSPYISTYSDWLKWSVMRLPTLCECSSPNWNAGGTLPTQGAISAFTLTNNGTVDATNDNKFDAWRYPLPKTELDKATGAHSYFYNPAAPATGQRIAEDVILTNVIGFDVKAWDPQAPVFSTPTAGAALVRPGDPNYYAVLIAAVWTTVGQTAPVGGVTYTLAQFGTYADLGYGNTPYVAGLANGLSHWGHQKSGLSAISINNARVYDTYSFHYENDGVREFTAPASTSPIIDAATNGFDDDGNGIVDDIVYNGAPTAGENETAPPYPIPLRGIQVKIRVFEPDSRQVREVTVVQDFLPQ